MKRALSIFLALTLILPPVWAAPGDPPARRSAAASATHPAATPRPGVLGNIQLTQVRLADIARMLSQLGNANVVVTGKIADETASLYLRNATVDDMVRNVCRAAGVWYRHDSGSNTYVIMSAEEYQRDLAIVRDEKTRVFTLRHHNVVAAANAIKALFGKQVALSMPVEEAPPVSLGAGNRTNAGGNRGSTNAGGAAGGMGASGQGMAGNGQFGNAQQNGMGGAMAGMSGMGGQGGQSGPGGTQGGQIQDPRADLRQLGQDRLASGLRFDASGNPVVGSADLADMAAKNAPTVFVTYNKLNNLLMVRTGDDAVLREIERLIDDMDRPPRQVLLEMQILEVTLDDGYRSVFDIGLSGRGTTSGAKGWAADSEGITARNSLGSGLFGVEQNANLIWQVMSSNLNIRLQLLANENKLKVLASPMLVASNNQPAKLFIGDERVLTVGASSQSTTGTTGATNTQITVETEKRDVGQTLAILPRINGDRTVSLTVDQDSSTVKIGDATIPVSTSNGQVLYFPIDTVNTANLQVTAHAKDGMTVAIGGMIRETVQRDEEKVPVLGDVPYLGFFFKRDVRAKTRSQIVLLITPRILENPEEADRLAQAKKADFKAQESTIPDTPIIPKLTNQPATTPLPALPTTRQTGDAAFAGLARSAAMAVRQQDPTAALPEGLQPAPLGSRDSLSPLPGLEARPAASWTRDGLYVTALQVVNLGPHAERIAPTLIPGRWAAMVIERPTIAPNGAADSWTWVYAISRQPFDQSVSRP